MTKFILTGFPRTGTTVVAGSILYHPEILFYGEIFSNTPQVRETEAARITMGAGWKLDRPLDWGIRPCGYTGTTGPYLDEFFSRDTPHKATGFKIMYDQVREGPNSKFWSYIAEHSDIHVIRTKRDDLLEVLCSFVRANVTRRWHTSDADLPNPRFIVPPRECEALLRRFTDMPDEMKEIDRTHPVLELDYERISNDFKGVMSDVYEFLGVTPVEVEPRLKKIARTAPREQLANYDELRAHFSGTEFERYFD